FPPYLIGGTITSDVFLPPQAARDNDATLDRGYHYPPLDYLSNGVDVSNGRLILTNGVTMGAYGARSIRLLGSGKLISEGLPNQLNRLVTLNAVQEQPLAWIDNSPAASMTLVEGSDLTLRFTDVSFLADSTTRRALLTQGGFAGSRTFRDSQFRGVY